MNTEKDKPLSFQKLVNILTKMQAFIENLTFGYFCPYNGGKRIGDILFFSHKQIKVGSCEQQYPNWEKEGKDI